MVTAPNRGFGRIPFGRGLFGRAIDHALYTTHVLTAGGRYYGDTYTDPATVT